jgi:hypothetical protein
MSKFDNNNPRRIEAISTAHYALKSTCQLYQWLNRDNELFVANGCVVLFEHNSLYYCFSNAHVLADSQLGKTFFLLRDGTAMTVGGQLFHSMPIASEKRIDDYLDIAIVSLNPNVVQRLLEDIYTLNELSTGDILLIAGYPASKTKIDYSEKRLKFNPLIARTVPYLRKFNDGNFIKRLHHIVEFPIKSFKETSTRQKMRAPHPDGISGSGLWLCRQGTNPVLIGILSEYYQKYSILISTKVDLFIDLIKHNFDPSLHHDGVKVELDYE